jgi:septum formation protein
MSTMSTSPTNSTIERAPRLILASASPRRSELLANLGVSFAVKPAAIDETLDSSLPIADAVALLAEQKARAVATQLEGGIVLGADTIVLLGHEVLGKPVDRVDAERMLRALRGRRHEVVTGIALVDQRSGRSERVAVTSRIRMRDVSDAEIARYVESGEPMDKAGSYAIQGAAAAFIAEIEGCYTNIVGLPLCETAALLRRSGLALNVNGAPCRLPSGALCPRLMPSRREP